MHVNNEIGSIQPISQISEVLRERNPDIIFHVDAVQSFTKLPLSPKDQGIDLLSISAHKFHGPKGVGALYLREGILLEPISRGGGHEKGLRPGTENTPGIQGMALAAKISYRNRKEKMKKLQSLKEQFITSLKTKHPWIRLNGPGKEEGAPHIFNISFPGLKGEVILHALEEHAIYVSTGSACHSGTGTSSHVLQAIKLDQESLEGAMFQPSHLNTRRNRIRYLENQLRNSRAKELLSRNPLAEAAPQQTAWPWFCTSAAGHVRDFHPLDCAYAAKCYFIAPKGIDSKSIHINQPPSVISGRVLLQAPEKTWP